MSTEAQIKITKKDGSFHLVPAGQKAQYEAFNAKNKKLRREKDIVTIEDYEAPAADAKKTAPAADAKKTAPELVALIKAATTVEEVEALSKDDKRATVVAAANDKIAELSAE